MPGFTEIFEVPELLQHITIAIAIGGLIGLEREMGGGGDSDKFAGLRTLALLCGSGPVVVFYGQLFDSSVLVSLYIGFGAVLGLSVAYIRFKTAADDIGLTTTVTVFFVTLLGVLVGYGQYFEAISIGIVTAFVLVKKKQMSKYVSKLSYPELNDSLKLGGLVFILFPILPSEPIDPYGLVVLREVLLFVIFVLLIEFAAYVAMRQFGGSKGLQITGLLAGMANSFATAGVMARMSNQSSRAVASASSGLMLSVISMIVRNVGIASVLSIAILETIWLPAITMVAVTFSVSLYLIRTSDTVEEFDIDIDSPFSFKAAGKFAVFYILITVVSVVSQQQFGDIGLLATAYTGGLVSSAAVAVSAATVLNSGTAGVEAAGGMVMLGIIASLTSKIALIEVISGQMRRKAIVPMVIIGIIGFLAYFGSQLI